jgi:Flp pilus assembly CpaF family ATPase
VLNGKGLRPPTRDDYAELQAAAAAVSRANFAALLGPLKPHLDDPLTLNVNCNADGAVFVEHAERGKFQAPETFDRGERELLIGNLANRNRTGVDTLRSRLACYLPTEYGYRVRVQAFAPPAGDWTLMLRAHAKRPRRLRDRWATSRPEFFDAVEAAIRRRDNMLISGRPGAGKTTHLTDLLLEMALERPRERLVLIEDRPEVQPSHADTISILAGVEQAAPDGRRYRYGFRDAIVDGLATDFDAIVVGELRDGESAHALLMAANTGVQGVCATVHADSAIDTLQRIEDLLLVAGVPPVRRMIARFVQVIVHLKMTSDRSSRYIAEVVRVLGVNDANEYQIESAA